MSFLTFINSSLILIFQYEFSRGCGAILILEDLLGLLFGFLVFSLMHNLRTGLNNAKKSFWVLDSVVVEV